MDFASDRMPEEVIEMILLMTPKKQTKDLMLVCKRFRDVIGGSVELMDRVKCWYLEKVDWSAMLGSNRKYRNLLIQELKEINFNIMETFISQQATTLTEVSLWSCKLKTSKLEFILGETAANLKTFSVMDCEIMKNTEMRPMELMPALERLVVNTNSFIDSDQPGVQIPSLLVYFTNTTLKELACKNIDEDQNSFGSFFSSQTRLNCLRIGARETEFFLKVLPASIRLGSQLTEIYFDGNRFSLEHQNHFDHSALIQFLESQRETLKMINLFDFDITGQLARSILRTKASKVELYKSRFVGDEKIEITNVSVLQFVCGLVYKSEDHEINTEREAGWADMIKCCVSVKKVEIEGDFEILAPKVMIALSQLQHLDDLDIKTNEIKCLETATIINFQHVSKLKLDVRYSYDMYQWPCQYLFQMILANKQASKILIPQDYQTIAEFQELLEFASIRNVEYLVW